VMPHDTAIPVDDLFISCADSKHIPTLYVPHGMFSPVSRVGPYGPGIHNFLRYLKMGLLGAFRQIRLDSLSRRRLIETGWLWIKLAFRHKLEGHGGCSKMAVFGDVTKELLVSEGISPERIAVTGNPKTDYVFATRGNDCKARVCQRWQIPQDRDIILLLTGYFVEYGQWTSDQRKQFIMAVCNATSKLPQCKLIIKLHPIVEKEADYQEIIKDLPDPPTICQDVALWELLHACSLAITVLSGAGLEAMAAGKPLVVLNLFGDQTPFDETGGATVVRKEDDLLRALETIICDGLSEDVKEAANKFVYRLAYVQDGKAAKRIADLIVQMAAERNQR
jgi:UDP-N-acetylglucosamine 2-epimerase